MRVLSIIGIVLLLSCNNLISQINIDSIVDVYVSNFETCRHNCVNNYIEIIETIEKKDSYNKISFINDTSSLFLNLNYSQFKSKKIEVYADSNVSFVIDYKNKNVTLMQRNRKSLSKGIFGVIDLSNLKFIEENDSLIISKRELKPNKMPLKNNELILYFTKKNNQLIKTENKLYDNQNVLSNKSIYRYSTKECNSNDLKSQIFNKDKSLISKFKDFKLRDWRMKNEF